jgi:adenylate cyclase
MAQEIERQFVVNDDHPEWKKIRDTLPKKRIIQTTIHRGDGNKLRVRLSEDLKTGKKDALFAFKVQKKSRKNEPNIRDEYEWEVPYRVALYIMIGHIEVRKLRHEYIHTDGKVWEVDVYEWANTGIVIADLELQSLSEDFEVPEWMGQETTKNKKISNNSFSMHPYMNWTEKEKDEFQSLKNRK